MRISTLLRWSFVPVVLFAITICNAKASNRALASFSQAAEAFLPQAESPVLFVGQIVEADSARLACAVTNSREFTYSVSTVLFGFAPSRPSEGGISGLCESGRAAFLYGRCVGARHVLWAGGREQPERASGSGNPERICGWRSRF